MIDPAYRIPIPKAKGVMRFVGKRQEGVGVATICGEDEGSFVYEPTGKAG